MKRIGIAALALLAAAVYLAPTGTAWKTYAVAKGLYDSTQPYRISTNPGGAIFKFIDDFEELRRSGRAVIVDGLCISACTLFTGTIPVERVCLTPFAVLAFHSATRMGEHSVEGTRILWNMYPEKIRELLRKRGWDGDPAGLGKPPKKGDKPATNEHFELIYIGVEDLKTIYRAC